MEIKNKNFGHILNNLLENCDQKLSENLITIRNLIDDFLNFTFSLENKNKLNQVISGTNQMITEIDQILELISKNSISLPIDWSLLLKKIASMNVIQSFIKQNLSTNVFF